MRRFIATLVPVVAAAALAAIVRPAPAEAGAFETRDDAQQLDSKQVSQQEYFVRRVIY